MNEPTNPESSLSGENNTVLAAREDKLDLELSPLDKRVAITEIDACNDHLAIANEPLVHQVAEIGMEAIDSLLSIATDMKTDNRDFVTGVKMHFGINDGQVTLIYQPLYMYRQPSALTEPFYDLMEGSNYVYDTTAGTFTEITDDEAGDLVSAYRSEIMIRHRTDNTFSAFIPNVDTESVIFPFQTIYALLHDNDAETLYIHNSIRMEDAGTSYRIKHCLLLSSESLNANSFAGKFANRSHLCPPSCNIVQYGLSKK